MTITLLTGHAIDELRKLPDASIHICVTSPPYWGLRKYGTKPQVWLNGNASCAEHQWGKDLTSDTREIGAGYGSNLSGWKALDHPKPHIKVSQGAVCRECHAWRGHLGMEPTPELYINHLLQVFAEVKRVLRADGTLWLNLGDSYAGSGGAHTADHANPGLSRSAYRNGAVPGKSGRGMDKLNEGLKPKDLVGIPWRVALALRDRQGWYLRQDIIWDKSNPMPESTLDRPTTSHEFIFLLSKSSIYYYDADAIREPHQTQGDKARHGFGPKTHGGMKANLVHDGNAYMTKGKDAVERTNGKRVGYERHRRAPQPGEPNAFHPVGRNRRSVWRFTTGAYHGAHFAVFPEALPEICIKAGSSEHGVCPRCGAPYYRVVERTTSNALRRQAGKEYNRKGTYQRSNVTSRMHPLGDFHDLGTLSILTVGWIADCACNAGAPIPATVLDPFSGSGTSGAVAKRLRRSFIGIDLKSIYQRQARGRIAKVKA